MAPFQFRQQDAHELLRQLLDGMELEEIDEIKKSQPAQAQADRQDRDRVLQFVQRLRKLSPQTRVSTTVSQPILHEPSTLLAAPSPLPSTPILLSVETPRSQSVPPESQYRSLDIDNGILPDPRRRSAEYEAGHLDPASEQEQTYLVPPAIYPPNSQGAPTVNQAHQTSSAFTSLSDISGLGRRISRKLRLPSRERSPAVDSLPPGCTSKDLSSGRTSPASLEQSIISPKLLTRSLDPSPSRRPLSSRGTEQPKIHKSRDDEAKLKANRRDAYMRALLRDIPTDHVHRHHRGLHGHLPSSDDLSKNVVSIDTPHAYGVDTPPLSGDRMLRPKFGGDTGIVECLKRFTAVEVLEGENAFACKRCWKKVNASMLLDRKKLSQAQESSSSSSDSSDTDWMGDSDVESRKESFTSSDSASLFASTSSTSPSTPAMFNVSHPLPSTSQGMEPGHDVLVQSTPTARNSELPHTLLVKAPSPLSPGVVVSQEGNTTSTLSPEKKRYSSGSATGQTAAVLHNPECPMLEPLPPKSERTISSRAFKRYLIATPPPVLVMHLKRFQQITKSHLAIFGNLKKVDDFVSFPEWLDLSNFIAPNKDDFKISQPRESGQHHRGWWKFGASDDHLGTSNVNKSEVLYRLYSVVVHIGSMLGGHYVAYTALPTRTDVVGTNATNATPETPSNRASTAPASAKSSLRNKERQWCYVSDTSVRPAPLDEVLKAKAYLCFYERIY
ncbi:hypothetical protein FRB99_006232 [Tulasnella sp. 403]|nr:hypothetical protein FRB99_006232 [Tulasnella sp. 403]